MKVSICIPTYRQVEFLRSTLKSVAMQDFDDYEVIVSDDSPDDSVRTLLGEFSFGDKLTYIRNVPALGSPENWNACIRLARGELVKILHHDDRFTRPDSLRGFVQLLDDHPKAEFGFSATLVEDVHSGLERVHQPTDAQLEELRQDPAALFLGNFVGAPSATICRRTLALEYDPRMKWLVDVDYYVRTLMANGEFAYTSQPLISTPTNAGHQVTEICRGDATIELSESLLLFGKLSPTQRQHPNVRRGWRHLFTRYRLRKLQHFERHGVNVPQEDSQYFEELMRRPLSRWHLVFTPRLLALKIFYRLYPHVPAFIRRPIKLAAGKFRRH